MCSPLYCSRFGTMRLAYLLPVVSAIFVCLCHVQLHAQVPQWAPAKPQPWTEAGFARSRPALLLRNEQCQMARELLPLRPSRPAQAELEAEPAR